MSAVIEGGRLVSAVGSVFTSTGSGPTQAAIADFTYRSSGPGVVWAYPFTNASELNQFRWSNGIGNDPSGTDPTTVYSVIEKGTGPGGYNCLAMTNPSGSTDANSAWWRPFSPLLSPGNGLPQNDPAANGTLTCQTWAPTTGSNTTANWGAGWYTQDLTKGANQDGVGFWFQTRVKMDPMVGGLPEGCKLIEFGVGAFTLSAQNIVTILNGTGQSGSTGVPNYHNFYIDGYVWDFFQGVNTEGGSAFQYGGHFTPIVYSTAGSAAPPSPMPSAANCTNGGFTYFVAQLNNDKSNYSGGSGSTVFCVPGSQGSYCWTYSGGWDTLLYHVVPGPANIGNNPTTTPTLCHIIVYGANAGQTSYQKLWDFGMILMGWEAANKPGWQFAYFLPYCNKTMLGPTSVTITSRYAQPIFSKNFIPCPQV